MVREEDALRRAIPVSRGAEIPEVSPLRKVVVRGQEGARPAAYWYSGAGRALFAEELNGRWRHIEYMFHVGTRLLNLRWTEGKPARLWSTDRVGASWGGPASPAGLLPEITFPAEELLHLEAVMQDVPHTLWARLIKVALEAHFIERPFPQRRQERPARS